MAVKKIEPVNMMLMDCNLGYDAKMLITPEDAATMMEIVGRSNIIVKSYGQDDTYQNGISPDLFCIRTYPVDKLNDLKKATFLGISLTEYLEAKKDVKPVPRESKEPV
jgi:hypothetical protein